MATSADMQDGISLCPSAAHRSVLGLVRAAVGGTPNPSLVSDLRTSAPADLVQISTYSYTHVVLATAFDRAPELADTVPADLIIYFREMQAANLRRNAAIRSQIETIGAALAAVGLTGVALKGAAELLDPVFDEPAFRFLSDVDILLPAAQIDAGFEALLGLGARPTEISEIDQAGHHHVEPLVHPDWPVALELHRSLAQGELAQVLPPEDVLAAARPSERPGLSVPAPAHRLAHAIQHAQLQPARYAEGELSVRDLIEAHTLEAALAPADVTEARARFVGDHGAAWDALTAARVLVLGDTGQSARPSPEARAWATRAIADFGRPGRRRLAASLQWAGWYLKEFFTNPERRRHYLSQLRDPGSLRRFVAKHRDRWTRTR